MSFEALRKDLKEGNRFWPNKEDLPDGEGDDGKDNASGGDKWSEGEDLKNDDGDARESALA